MRAKDVGELTGIVELFVQDGDSRTVIEDTGDFSVELLEMRRRPVHIRGVQQITVEIEHRPEMK